MSEKKFDVIGIGSHCVDYLLHVGTLPTHNKGSRIQQASWQCGGKVPTGMTAAARCGLKCSMIGAVSDDLFGQYCVKDFQYHGIDDSHMIIRPNTTGDLGVAISDEETNGRSIIYRRGTSPRITEEEIDFSFIEQGKYLFIAGVDDMHVHAAKYAKEHGVEVLIDADNGELSKYDNIIQYIDYFVASEFVYRNTFQDEDYEKRMKEILARGPKVVVFTFGEDGCRYYSEEDGYGELPAFKIQAVDTTGAGDTYHGAFFYGLTHGYNLRETCRFASAVSAIKCSYIGGRSGQPTPDITLKFIETGVIDDEKLQERVKRYEWGINNFFRTEM